MVADRATSSYFQRVAFWQPSNLKWSPFKIFGCLFFLSFLSVSHQLVTFANILVTKYIFTCHGDQNGCNFSPLAAPHFLINYF